MECKEVRAHLVDLVSGATPANVEVETHLQACQACARELDELSDTWHLLGSIPGSRPDSRSMRATLDATLAGFDAEPQDLPPLAGPPARVVSTWVRRPAWQLGLAAAVLLAGVALGRLTPSRPSPDPQLAALRQEVRDMRQLLTLSLMQQASASDRLKGVASTVQIDQPGMEVVQALLDTLKHDANVNVRLASIDALRRFGDREAVRHGALDAVPRQTSPLVQIALIDFLAEVAGRESSATLRSLAEDARLDRVVRDRAASALKRVS
jgi:hypothetical protein